MRTRLRPRIAAIWLLATGLIPAILPGQAVTHREVSQGWNRSQTAGPQKPAITPLQATYRTIVLSNGQPQDAGSRSVTVMAVDADKRAAWRVISVLRYQDLVSADTVEFLRADLHPLSRHAKIGDGELTLVVDGETARGLLVISDRLTPLNVPLGKASFLNYYALRTALAGWPIDSSWRTEASVLELNGEPQFIPVTLAVAGG